MFMYLKFIYNFIHTFILLLILKILIFHDFENKLLFVYNFK